MKHKKVTLIISLLFLFINIVKAQTFFDDTLKYFIIQTETYSGTEYRERPFTYKLIFDSLVAETEYYSFLDAKDNFFIYTQISVNKNKLFIEDKYDRFGNKDTTFLIYDFNLNPGDSFITTPPFGIPVKLRIDSVNHIQINGRSRKIQYVSGEAGGLPGIRNYTFVEGIGSLENGIEYYLHIGFEVMEKLSTVCLNDSILFKNTNSYYTCDFNLFRKLVSINDNLKLTKSNFKLYPNPTSGHLILQTKPLQTNATLTIYNLKGECVFSQYYNFIDGKINLNLSHLPASEYFVRLTSKENTITEKIIIVD